MALKIRLRQQGRNNRTSYRLVVTDCRSMRDGKYVEMLGWYDPLVKDHDSNVSVKPDRVQHWLSIGAQLSERAESLIARAAPEVLRTYKQKVLAQRAKACAKRKATRRKKAAAAKAQG